LTGNDGLARHRLSVELMAAHFSYGRRERTRETLAMIYGLDYADHWTVLYDRNV